MSWSRSTDSKRCNRSTASLPEIIIPEYRLHLFKTLHKTGKLAALIEEAEAKLKESPRNEVLVARLKTYHTVAGNAEQLTELEKLQEELDLARPDRRLTQINNLLNMNRPEEAAAQAKLLMELDPDFVATGGRNLIYRFQQKKELRRFAQVCEQIDWSRYDRFPDVLPMVIEQLAAESATEEVATKLFVTKPDAPLVSRKTFVVERDKPGAVEA